MSLQGLNNSLLDWQGILSGLAYYIFGLLVKERGPVFMSASNPLSLVMVAILGSFIFKEKFYLGRYAACLFSVNLRMNQVNGELTQQSIIGVGL
jgi:hypothetical protein